MKTNLYFLLCLLFIGCTQSNSEGYILWDLTNKTQVPISANGVCNSNGITMNKNGDHHLHIKEITGFEYSITKELYLPKMKIGKYHPRKREQELAGFQDHLDMELQHLFDHDTVIQTTSIYNELIRSLNTLSESEAENRYLIIVSDMCENTDNFSIYRLEDLDLLINHPVEVERKFIKQIEPKDLTGINIYIVFQPNNDEENARFALMAKFFRDLLERNHAHVTIQANLYGN